MFRKILVANRGEIAVRVLRACRELGIKGVAIYSDADRSALHVQYADEAYRVGPPPSAESYLNIPAILEAAKQSGCDAVHPGYGFLSERAAFAEACQEAGLTFIGPPPSAISAMGDKVQARKRMIEAKVPVVPGTPPLPEDPQRALEQVLSVGFPVMLKASAGGGGKGMRIVSDEREFASALLAARSEAQKAFGDDQVYAERFLEEPHHIEIQILADSLGNTIHLFERECSIQRRHQKVIEESPSPFVSREIVSQMGEIAVRAARAVGYVGAGTVEFLVDKHRNFYFLEMNTRLQVEHPITEETTGIDLVKEQIRIAQGEPLGRTQEEVFQRGHAIECRIYAEDPENNFLPSPGRIERLVAPGGIGVRHDEGFGSGNEVPLFYDPMIAKLIVWGPDRESALARMRRALEEYRVSGIKTNLSFHRAVLRHPAFLQGGYHTGFIDEHLSTLLKSETEEEALYDALAVAAIAAFRRERTLSVRKEEGKSEVSRWKWADRTGGGWK